MVFMIATMVFVMAFPTLASAMTGYTGKTELVIKVDGNTQTPFRMLFREVKYIIQDGNRVNLSAGFQVFSERFSGTDYVEDYISQYGIQKSTPSSWTQIDDYGFETDLDPIALQSPTLNITIYDGKVNDKLFIYIPNNTTYTLSYIEENSICQPAMANSQQTYQWGFSVLQLEVTLVLLTIWTLGVWVMWLDAHLSLTTRGRYEVPHGFKAVLYLADSIRNDFNDLSEEPELLTDEELRKYAADHLRGGKVQIQVSEYQFDFSLWLSSWHWLKTNKLWASAFLVALASSWWFCGQFVVVFIMWLATAAHWKRKTRAVVAWTAFIIGIPISLKATPPVVYFSSDYRFLSSLGDTSR